MQVDLHAALQVLVIHLMFLFAESALDSDGKTALGRAIARKYTETAEALQNAIQSRQQQQLQTSLSQDVDYISYFVCGLEQPLQDVHNTCSNDSGMTAQRAVCSSSMCNGESSWNQQHVNTSDVASCSHLFEDTTLAFHMEHSTVVSGDVGSATCTSCSVATLDGAIAQSSFSSQSSNQEHELPVEDGEPCSISHPQAAPSPLQSHTEDACDDQPVDAVLGRR